MLPGDGLLSFPLTAFDSAGALDLPAFRAHLEDQVASGPAAVFVACGTGEYSALNETEYADLVAAAVETVAGRVPVVVGAGGGPGSARRAAQVATDAGADGLLLMPPYLVAGPPAGVLDHVRYVAAATSLPLIVYRRATQVFGPATALELLDLPTVIGIKDGVGDIDMLTRITTAVRTSGHPRSAEFRFLNGMPTAELSALALRGLGIVQYSSAIFCFAPDIALAFHAALHAGDDDRCRAILKAFYLPFADLRDTTPGYHVALVKAGARLRGYDVGGVRPPLVDATPAHVGELKSLIDAARAAITGSG
jgi:5-dehydro-4-deoxyglucarate dehydratase